MKGEIKKSVTILEERELEIGKKIRISLIKLKKEIYIEKFTSQRSLVLTRSNRRNDPNMAQSTFSILILSNGGLELK